MPNADNESSLYWDRIAERDFDSLWRRHADTLNAELIRRWLGGSSGKLLLKTDAFDEAMGDGSLGPLLPEFRSVFCTDISPSILARATARHPRLAAMAADIRSIPLPDQSADCVVSLSTLDHFQKSADISVALREIFRILRPGGRLLLTLDNLDNPVVRLRNNLPASPLQRSGIVPYFVGATLGRRGLDASLTSAGFEIVERSTLMHCPRVFAVQVTAWAERMPRSWHGPWLRLLYSVELLRHLPTRLLTGYFLAVLARRPLL